MNKPGLLARMFGRSKHPVVASLATAALNRPLLVHPAMGEALIGAYLEGAVTSEDTLFHVERIPRLVSMEAPAGDAEAGGDAAVVPTEFIAVLNITGALVSRPMPGPSGGGPISYTGLRSTFDELMEDEQITAIVFRIESPGGSASGCMDFSDHVFKARGTKPLIALVDDYAYSAAYAIASACDSIWVSRTGGVGSIGVCGFHYDWSGYDKQLGLKVTPIYAGAKKVDFSPHFALSDEAKADAQENIDAHYALFTTTVARNLGLSVDAIVATEAGTFQGQKAIDAGLATNLGTWDDMVASLGHSETPAPEQTGDGVDDDNEVTDSAVVLPAEAEGAPAPADETVIEEAAAAAATPEQKQAAFAMAISDSTLSDPVAFALLKRGHMEQDPQEAVAYAGEVIDACAAAGITDLASDFVKANTSIDIVRTQLLAAKAEDGPEIVTALPATGAAKKGDASSDPLNPKTIYQQRGN